MSSRLPWLAGALVLASLAASIAPASAAETGTKTMPDSSIYPPPTPPPVFDTSPRRDVRCRVARVTTTTASTTNSPAQSDLAGGTVVPSCRCARWLVATCRSAIVYTEQAAQHDRLFLF
jgi:hypothetical protein